MHTEPETETFDILTNVECFLRRGPESIWGIDWWVPREDANDFAAYLDIIGVRYYRQLINLESVQFIRLCHDCRDAAS